MHQAAELSFTAGEVAAGLESDRCDLTVVEARPGPATGHGGSGVPLRDSVLRAGKHP